MATALPHAPPTKAAFPHVKLSNALVPVKGQSHAEASAQAPKAKFQSLLDKLTPQALKPAATTEAVPNPKTAKTKVPEPLVEKPKDPKKPDPKHPKDHAGETDGVPGWLAGLQPGKADAAKVAKPETEAVATATDKAKTPKTDRKPGTDATSTLGATSASLLGNGTPATQASKTSSQVDRTDEKPKVFVVDRRSDKEKEKLKLPGAEGSAQQPVNASVEVQNPNKVTDPKASNDVQVSFQTVGNKTPDGFDLKPSTTPVPPRDAATFQQYLVEKGYGQLVDQARIVLKDQNAGEIRMTLYPETLGKVKVALNLTDSSLAGQIFVENQTVKDVFQANMDGLMQAFRDGGWSDLSLQVSVGNGNAGGQQGQQSAPPPVPQARDYDHQVTQTATEARTDRIGSWNDRQVNLTA